MVSDSIPVGQQLTEICLFLLLLIRWVNQTRWGEKLWLDRTKLWHAWCKWQHAQEQKPHQQWHYSYNTCIHMITCAQWHWGSRDTLYLIKVSCLTQFVCVYAYIYVVCVCVCSVTVNHFSQYKYCICWRPTWHGWSLLTENHTTALFFMYYIDWWPKVMD